jgi:hypothetical protein
VKPKKTATKNGATKIAKKKSVQASTPESKPPRPAIKNGSAPRAKAPASKSAASKSAASKVGSKAGTIGEGTRASPWQLKTPSGTSEFTAHLDDAIEPPALVVRVGKTELRYHLRCIEDLHAMLKTHGDWMMLGSTDEQKPAVQGTVEAWGRSPKNPVKGWYGIKKGLRGRFAMYVPPVLELLGLAEVEHGPKNNRIRAI